MSCSRVAPFAENPQLYALFFEPVHLHRQLTNFSLQLGAFLFSILVLRGIPALEKFGNPIEKFFFSVADLHGMHLVLGHNLIDGINTLHRFQCDSCLELRRVFSSLFFHSSYPSHLWSYTPKPNLTTGSDS